MWWISASHKDGVESWIGNNHRDHRVALKPRESGERCECLESEDPKKGARNTLSDARHLQEQSRKEALKTDFFLKLSRCWKTSESVVTLLGPKQTIRENKSLSFEPNFPLDFGPLSRLSVYITLSPDTQEFAMETFVMDSLGLSCFDFYEGTF